MHLLEELNRLGTTIVVATHNMALVDRLGYPVLRLDSGRLTTKPGSGNKSAGREWRESRESVAAQVRARRRKADEDDADAVDPPGIENFPTFRWTRMRTVASCPG